jgi:hypothetical protein
MLLLITGASGVGKSTVRELVAPVLLPLVESVELAHLSQLPAAPTRIWRQRAAESAVQRAVELQAHGRHLLLAGDPVPAVEVVAAPSATGLDAIAVCLLDVAPEAQAERLRMRGDDPNVLPHHHAFAEWMRRQATDPLHMTHVVSENGWEAMRWDRLGTLVDEWAMQVIDTTAMAPDEVARDVLDWCSRALAGDVPTLRVSD